MTEQEEWEIELGKTQQLIEDIKNNRAKFSPRLKELAEQAVQSIKERDEMLAKMSPEEQKKYWEDWAKHLAESMCDPNALGGP